MNEYYDGTPVSLIEAFADTMAQMDSQQPAGYGNPAYAPGGFSPNVPGFSSNVPGFGRISGTAGHYNLPAPPTEEEIEAYKQQKIAEGVKNGLLRYTPQQEMERSKNDQAIAWLKSNDEGMPEELRAKEIEKFRKANSRITPIPVPPDKQPRGPKEQIANQSYKDEQGRTWVVDPKSGKWDVSKYANAQEKGQGNAQQQIQAQPPQFGSNAASINDYVKQRTAYVPEMGGWVTVNERGMPVVIKNARQSGDDPAEEKRRQEREKEIEARQKLIQSLYEKNIEKQYDSSTKGEIDPEKARKYAIDQAAWLNYEGNPVNQEYESWLKQRYGTDGTALFHANRMAQEHSPEDAQYLQDAIELLEKGKTKGAPSGWKAPEKSRRAAVPDTDMMSVMQTATRNQMKDWIYHATREEAFLPGEFEKQSPGGDYGQYMKMRGFVKKNADQIPQLWELLQKQPIVNTNRNQSTSQSQNNGKPSLRIFKPNIDENSVDEKSNNTDQSDITFSKVDSISNVDEFKARYNELPSGTVYIGPDGKKRIKK